MSHITVILSLCHAHIARIAGGNHTDKSCADRNILSALLFMIFISSYILHKPLNYEL